VLASRDGKIVCENTLDARLQVVFRKKLPEVSHMFFCFLWHYDFRSDSVQFTMRLPSHLWCDDNFLSFVMFTDPSKPFWAGSSVTNSWKHNVAQYSLGYPDDGQEKLWQLNSDLPHCFGFPGYGGIVIRFRLLNPELKQIRANELCSYLGRSSVK
jgi:hypothetical protein